MGIYILLLINTLLCIRCSAAGNHSILHILGILIINMRRILGRSLNSYGPCVTVSLILFLLEIESGLCSSGFSSLGLVLLYLFLLIL